MHYIHGSNTAESVPWRPVVASSADEQDFFDSVMLQKVRDDVLSTSCRGRQHVLDMMTRDYFSRYWR